MLRVLVVDDDPAMVKVVSDLCAAAGYVPIAYTPGQAALELIRKHAPQVIVSNVQMEGFSGLEILHAAKTGFPKIPVIFISAQKQPELAVQAMREGAFDYIFKPFKVGQLSESIRRALDENTGSDRAHRKGSGLREHLRFENIVGQSVRMQEVFDVIEKVANTDSTILIGGESGTGKELVARALHFKSERKGRPFVAINCSALPENLLESELFGHKKGAFTGAVQDKVGLFEEAEGGTVFLDEINSMAPLLQTKLLRVLQERVVRRVGDNHNIPIHVRVLAATNEPLHEKMKAGGFRQDLYYRLAVIPVEIPALRERADDIPLLVEHFLQKHSYFGRQGGTPRIEAAALRALRAYHWPGNVRELENAIERASVLCDDGVICPHDLPPHITTYDEVVQQRFSVFEIPSGVGSADINLDSVSLPIGETLDSFIAKVERRFIRETLLHNDGVRDKAAQMLGISTATLYRKLENERKLDPRHATTRGE
jgi:DNA-binding NtrC family response regulator